MQDRVDLILLHDGGYHRLLRDLVEPRPGAERSPTAGLRVPGALSPAAIHGSDHQLQEDGTTLAVIASASSGGPPRAIRRLESVVIAAGYEEILPSTASRVSSAVTKDLSAARAVAHQQQE